MKTTKKVNPKFLAFTALMFFVAIAVFSRTTVASTTSTFTVPLQPNITPRTPTNYLFGSGTWYGTIVAGHRYEYTLQSQIVLTGGEPNTWFIVKIYYMNANGQPFAFSYWGMATDSNGNGGANIDTSIPHGAVAVCLGLYDASNFQPPLQVMISDPDIGGDSPT